MEKSTSLESLSLSKPDSHYSVDEAVSLAARVHVELQSVEDYRLMLKWALGHVVFYADKQYGSGVVDQIAERLWREHQIKASRSLLYEAEKLFRVKGGDYREFAGWIESEKQRLGRPVYWGDVQRAFLGGASNPRVIGEEQADQKDFLLAEQGFEALERIKERAEQGDEEAQGVVAGIQQQISDFVLPKETGAPRNPAYLTFVREFPCLVCGDVSEAHHELGVRGVSSKASDYGAIPLCHTHHMELHAKGRDSFAEAYGLDVVEVALNLLHRWVTGQWLTMRL